LLPQVFWLLWLSDLLFPALVARNLFTLLRQYIRPHYTYAELVARREDNARAQTIASVLYERLASPGRSSAKSATRATRARFKEKLSRVRARAGGNKSSGQAGQDGTSDLPQKLLFVIYELADFHERLQK
jgi:hypothetical protein